MTPKEFLLLTPSEAHVYFRLYKTNGDDPWSIKIRQITRGGTAEDFRKLLSELKDAANDGPDTMQTIIGPVAFNALMKYSFS